MSIELAARPAAAAPWLSVLIPVYRVERYLEDCVHSVLSQADPGVEVLLFDDASPDASGDIALRLCRQHPGHVRLLRNDRNGGLSAARNTLVEHATGRYVWHLDSDDVMLPGAIGKLRAVVEAKSPDLVLCDFRVLRERVRWKHRLRGERHRRTFDGPSNRIDGDRSRLMAGMMRMRHMHAWTKIARRQVWSQVTFPPGRSLLQDVASIAALIGATRSYIHIDEPWVGYRQHRQSALASADGTRIGHALEALEDLQRSTRDLCPLSAEARFAVDYFVMKTFLGVAKMLERNRIRDQDLEQRCRQTLARLFADGGCGVLAQCRSRRWYLRARRIDAQLRRGQWFMASANAWSGRPAGMETRAALVD